MIPYGLVLALVVLALSGCCSNSYNLDAYSANGFWTFSGFRNRDGEIPFNGAGYTFDGSRASISALVRPVAVSGGQSCHFG